MDGRVSIEYGNELFKEHKVYRLGGRNYAFVIEDMDEVERGWRVWMIEKLFHDCYYRNHKIIYGTKQEVMARINNCYE
jgi:hypothetical protein